MLASVIHGLDTFARLGGSQTYGDYIVELETKAIRRFAKVSIVSYSRPSLMIIVSGTQFHVYLPWGQPGKGPNRGLLLVKSAY